MPYLKKLRPIHAVWAVLLWKLCTQTIGFPEVSLLALCLVGEGLSSGMEYLNQRIGVSTMSDQFLSELEKLKGQVASLSIALGFQSK